MADHTEVSGKSCGGVLQPSLVLSLLLCWQFFLVQPDVRPNTVDVADLLHIERIGEAVRQTPRS